jgi:phosphoribosylformylglycinamidine cyclo-ligase
MVALVAPADADRAVAVLGEHDVPAWVAGTVGVADAADEGGRVRLVGQHA